jgi:hypothetical protein
MWTVNTLFILSAFHMWTNGELLVEDACSLFLFTSPRYDALFFEQVEFSVQYIAVVSRLRVYSHKRRFRSPDVDFEHSGYRT